jgi:hypothetical protein
VTRLRVLGVSHAEIGAFTGHKTAKINAILEKHYAASDPSLVANAVRAMEIAAKSPNRLPNRAGGSSPEQRKA